MTIRIYLEGGSEGSTKSNCRKAFSTFLSKVVPPCAFKVIASGNRTQAFQDFSLALRQHPDAFNMLLVDSESAVVTKAWEHLRKREGDNWTRPTGATDDQVHLMVQVMEAWFIADQETLSKYYKQKFSRATLPRQSNIEKIEKKTVLDSLNRASKHTQKGSYHKTKHGFELLELIDPQLVGRASQHAKRLFEVLSQRMNG